MEHLPGDPGAVAEDGISSRVSSRTTVRVPVGQRPPNHLSASYYPQHLCPCCLGRVGKWVGLFVCLCAYMCVCRVFVCMCMCLCVCGAHTHWEDGTQWAMQFRLIFLLRTYSTPVSCCYIIVL